MAPRRDHRLDVVTFDPDCQDCESVTIEVAWSEGAPVLMTARPQFDLYIRKPGNFRVSIPVEYGLYDQYGETVSSTAAGRTGRDGTTLKGQLAYRLYSVQTIAGKSVVPIDTGDLASFEPMGFSHGRFTRSVSAEILPNDRIDEGFLVVLVPRIFSDSNTAVTEDSLDIDEVRYAENPGGGVGC